MDQQTQIVPVGTRRLVLGFDGGCMQCNSLAQGIEEHVGDKLEVLSLNDPQVELWRRNALGKDAPWAPTLIEVKGLRVRAWTGWKMGVQLSRFLGPVSTWRVMQVLGELNAVPRIEQSLIVEKLPERASEAVTSMSRGQFIKGVGGAAVAMSVLSSIGPLSRPIEAAESWHMPNFTKSRQLRGAELRDYCNKVAKRSDCEWLAGGWAAVMQSGLQVTSATDQIASRNGVRARAAIHTTASGNEMYACTFDLQGKKLISFYWYKNMRRNIKTWATRWGGESSGQKVWGERMTVNGARYTDPGAPSLQAQAACPEQCQSLTGQRQSTICSNIDFSCVATVGGCGVCATGTCATGNAIACGLCLLVVCPSAIIATCCRTTCTVCTPCAPFTT